MCAVELTGANEFEEQVAGIVVEQCYMVAVPMHWTADVQHELWNEEQQC